MQSINIQELIDLIQQQVNSNQILHLDLKISYHKIVAAIRQIIFLSSQEEGKSMTSSVEENWLNFDFSIIECHLPFYYHTSLLYFIILRINISFKKMNAQTLKYLQKDEIGKVIATGLAELYMSKPSKPVKYLAEWLQTYSRNQKQMAKLVQKQKQKQNVLKTYQKQVEAKVAAQKQKNVKDQKEKKQIDEFKKMITSHQYHADLLLQILAEFIEKNINSTGVYIAELNHPSKEVKDEDVQQLAHLDTSADKVLNYFGSSVSHKQLMRGKTLKTNQGVTANSFALLEEVPAPVVGEDGQQIPQPIKPKYVFVPNVVKNQSIHYFKIPKLGSYLAIPIICNEYLSQVNFDSALKQKLEYIKQHEELQAAKKTDLAQLHKQKEQLQKKLAEIIQKNTDESQIQPLKSEIKQVQQAIVQKQKQRIEQKQPQLQPMKKKYVICTDTLGKDRVLEQKQIDFVVDIVDHFRNSWQSKQKQLLKKDIEYHISTLKNIQESEQDYKQILINSQQLNEEQQKQITAIPEQSKRSYHQLQLQVQKMKNLLKQNGRYIKQFLNLCHLRVPKYKQLIQNVLFFIGFNKSAVNQSNRTTLNWREVRRKFINQEVFGKILDYQPIGPKQGNYASYSKIPQLAQLFDKYQDEQVFKYNIGLGAILSYIKKAIELRQMDVQIRKAKFEADKKQRQRLIEQNEKINSKLTQQLQKHKGALTGQDAQKFNEQEWKNQFYSKQPLHSIPDEPHEDKDNDM